MLWSPPIDSTPESIAEALLALGARQWQVDIAGPILEAAINRPAPATAEISTETTAEVTGEVTSE